MDQTIRLRIESNIPFVEHIVTRMSAKFPQHTERSELVNAGMMGLVEASLRFDPDRGVAFSTFAGRRIEGAVLDVIRREDWVPRSVRAKARELLRAEESLATSGRHHLSEPELAEAAGMTVAEMQEIRAKVRNGVLLALDRPLRADGANASTIGEALPDDTAVDPSEMLERREMNSYIRSAIKLLPERHRVVVTAYFLDEMSMDEIAALLGVTQSRVSQLKDDALERIRGGLSVQYQETQDDEPALRRRDRSRAQYAAAISAAETPSERLAVPVLVGTG
jgi:RNA polymerase sigma factor for flagellar operon FliA